MGKITIAFVLVVALLLIGGGVFLALPDARFPK